MNKLNYASLEASKRLVEAGIILETETKWIIWPTGLSEIVYRLQYRDADVMAYPAPCMAEVWRELPELIDEYDITCEKIFNGGMQAGYTTYDVYDVSGLRWKVLFNNTNPTDALVDLLIWVRKEADDADDQRA